MSSILLWNSTCSYVLQKHNLYHVYHSLSWVRVSLAFLRSTPDENTTFSCNFTLLFWYPIWQMELPTHTLKGSKVVKSSFPAVSLGQLASASPHPTSKSCYGTHHCRLIPTELFSSLGYFMGNNYTGNVSIHLGGKHIVGPTSFWKRNSDCMLCPLCAQWKTEPSKEISIYAKVKQKSLLPFLDL